MAKYTVDNIADWILARTKIDAGDTISPLKLQKLVYYAQAWHLTVYNEPLFDDAIEAWKHGPVVRALWNRFTPIPFNANIPINEFVKESPNLEMKTHDLLEEVMSVYGEHSAAYLEDLTHSEEPWKIARGDTPPQVASWTPISHESMKEYYSSFQKDGE